MRASVRHRGGGLKEGRAERMTFLQPSRNGTSGRSKEERIAEKQKECMRRAMSRPRAGSVLTRPSCSSTIIDTCVSTSAPKRHTCNQQ